MTPARNNVRATRHFGIPARKNSPGTPLHPFPREKTRPARPSIRSHAKKFAQQQPHLGRTAKTLAQRAQKHQNLAIFPEQGELFRVSNAAPPSRENFLPQLHHSIPITGTPPPIHHPNRYKTLPTTPATRRNRYKTLPTTPTINENWPFLASKENYFPFPTPHHRAGRIFSRNYTTQYPSQGHHHPNRHKTHPATPPTTCSARGTSQHARKSSPSTPSNRSRAKKLSQRAQKHQNLANFPEQGELFRVSQTNSPRRANFFAQIQHSTCNSGTPLARHTQQSTHTLVIERKPLVVHRLSFPLVVIHRLTRKA